MSVFPLGAIHAGIYPRQRAKPRVALQALIASNLDGATITAAAATLALLKLALSLPALLWPLFQAFLFPSMVVVRYLVLHDFHCDPGRGAPLDAHQRGQRGRVNRKTKYDVKEYGVSTSLKSCRRGLVVKSWETLEVEYVIGKEAAPMKLGVRSKRGPLPRGCYLRPDLSCLKRGPRKPLRLKKAPLIIIVAVIWFQVIREFFIKADSWYLVAQNRVSEY